MIARAEQFTSFLLAEPKLSREAAGNSFAPLKQILKESVTDSLPRNIDKLLNHNKFLTGKLKKHKNKRNPIKVDVLSKSYGDNNEHTCSRTVLLRDKESGKILSLGVIKINLDTLKDVEGCEAKILGEIDPFGQILHELDVQVKHRPSPFYAVRGLDKKALFSFLSDEAQTAFGLNKDDLVIYGRKNQMFRAETNKKIADVYEFLAQ